MHQSAYMHAEYFYKTYIGKSFKLRKKDSKVKVLEIGSQDVNGSIRKLCPADFSYIGVDFLEGKNVDVILDDPYKLPFNDSSVDLILSSSCFEHSEFFWVLFLEIMRVLKDDGLFYLNAPSNGFFHQWPVDCWRFYPDSGHALINWAKRNNFSPLLLESFTGVRSQGSVSEGGMWNDFVAVFLKNKKNKNLYKKRMLDFDINFHNGYKDKFKKVLNFDQFFPDFRLIMELEKKNEQLITKIKKTQAEKKFIKREIQSLYNSKTFRYTSFLRYLHKKLRSLFVKD